MRSVRFPVHGHDGAGNLSGRTGATARGQVKVKVMLGKVFPVGPARRFGHQPASRVGEGLAGPAVPIAAASPMASSTTEPVLASLCSTSSNAPKLSGATLCPYPARAEATNW